MPDHALTEEPVQFGQGGRLFGILTQPNTPHDTARELPVFIFLSAGLLHRVGPYRLHVRLARELGAMGFSALRVDLASVGDSPARVGLTNQQSVAADFAEIVEMLSMRLRRSRLVLAGLCSGADNVARLAFSESGVVGMVLLDPVCYPDRGFRTRVRVAKYTTPARYVGWVKRRLSAIARPTENEPVDDTAQGGLAIRDLPTLEQMRASFQAIGDRGGRVLSVFTSYALGYYNQSGQLGRSLDLQDYQTFCTELFWPGVHHTYRLELHRRRLIEEIKTWARAFV